MRVPLPGPISTILSLGGLPICIQVLTHQIPTICKEMRGCIRFEVLVAWLCDGVKRTETFKPALIRAALVHSLLAPLQTAAHLPKHLGYLRGCDEIACRAKHVPVDVVACCRIGEHLRHVLSQGDGPAPKLREDEASVLVCHR